MYLFHTTLQCQYMLGPNYFPSLAWGGRCFGRDGMGWMDSSQGEVGRLDCLKVERSQTGLPEYPPTFHDPCPWGPVTVVCHLHLAGAEAIVSDLVLTIKHISIDVALPQSG